MWGLKFKAGSAGELDNCAEVRGGSFQESSSQFVEKILAESQSKKATIKKLYSHAVKERDSREAIIEGMDSYARRLTDQKVRQLIERTISSIEVISMLEILKGIS